MSETENVMAWYSSNYLFFPSGTVNVTLLIFINTLMKFYFIFFYFKQALEFWN